MTTNKGKRVTASIITPLKDENLKVYVRKSYD